ncbi:unnamed protein product [Closterium sp. Yama58-4]|nr:unnamed protein product [Closterium sp. Yama58-4]
MSVLARASRKSAVFRSACFRLAVPAIAWRGFSTATAGASPVCASSASASASPADASPAVAGRAFEEAASGGRVTSASVDGEEVAKFEALASQWWDRRGPHAPLHAMSAARVAFVRDAMCRHFGLNADSARPLEGLRVLDVGCGGGLLCEPLARLGATVTGVDVTRVNTQVAAAHAARDPTTRSISYKCISAEELATQGATFDAVLSLEVIEHVADPAAFVRTLTSLCRPTPPSAPSSPLTPSYASPSQTSTAQIAPSPSMPMPPSTTSPPTSTPPPTPTPPPVPTSPPSTPNPGGMLFLSTINRTARSFALAIAAAEYILSIVPRGTHDWNKFITPLELALMLRRTNFQLAETRGMVYDPISNRWNLSRDDMAVNYIAMATCVE